MNHQSLRKVAILIDSLDGRSADQLLEQMSDEQAAQVRNAVIQLSDVTQQERDEIIAEFVGKPESPNADDAEYQGVEVEFSAAAQGQSTARQPRANGGGANAGNTAGQAPFAWLKEAKPASVAGLLAQEHPQIAAVVVAHLPPTQAAEVLTGLPPDLQTEVVRRIVDLDEASVDVLQEVEHQLASLLSHQVQSQRRRREGVAAMGTILASVGDAGRAKILENLANRDRDLAETIGQATRRISVGPSTMTALRATDPASVSAPAESSAKSRKPLTIEPTPQEQYGLPSESIASASDDEHLSGPVQSIEFSFHDLQQLDDRALAAVLAAAQSDLAILALTGAPRPLVERVLKQLSRRQARALTQRMQQTGPLRLRDIEAAQNQLAEIAGGLVARGVIDAPSSRRFAVAA